MQITSVVVLEELLAKLKIARTEPYNDGNYCLISWNPNILEPFPTASTPCAK